MYCRHSTTTTTTTCSFEIVKFGVAPSYQKRGIGKALFAKAMEFAKEAQAQQLILYTVTTLFAATEIYKKYQFQFVKVSDKCNKTFQAPKSFFSRRAFFLFQMKVQM